MMCYSVVGKYLSRLGNWVSRSAAPASADMIAALCWDWLILIPGECSVSVSASQANPPRAMLDGAIWDGGIAGSEGHMDGPRSIRRLRHPLALVVTAMPTPAASETKVSPGIRSLRSDRRAHLLRRQHMVSSLRIGAGSQFS